MDEFDIRGYMHGAGAMLAGVANVIMQLSRPEIGYAVLESRVESGQVTKHPLKRFRTTFTYLAVAMLGTDDERIAYRHAVDRSHAQVRSTAASPVDYDAFDRELQLWVAACLYFGTVDLHERMHGPVPHPDELYAHAARFGTTLQVRPEQWPADRAAFAEYWQRSLPLVRIDDPVRAYLCGLMKPAGRFGRFVTTGLLPAQFREQMQLPWTSDAELRFNRFMHGLGRTERSLPLPVRVFPFNAMLADMRRRARHGRPLV